MAPLSFKHAAHGSDTVYITTSNLSISITLPSTDFTRFAFIAAAFRLEKIIIVVDLPGHLGDLAISYLVSHKPSWYPYPLTKEVWRCFPYPFFALPAWWFVGLGIDTFLGRRRVGRKGLAVSLVLGLIFAVVAAPAVRPNPRGETRARSAFHLHNGPGALELVVSHSLRRLVAMEIQQH